MSGGCGDGTLEDVAVPGGRPVVAGVDGSAPALHAVRWAAQDAQRHRVPLHLVSAVWAVPDSQSSADAVPQLVVEDVQAEGQRRLREAEEVATRAAPGIEITFQLSHGSPAQVLVEASEHARRAVVGSRGLGEFTGLLVGSTGEALVSYGKCPVVVVRGRAPGDEPLTTGPVVVGVDGSGVSDAAVAAAFEEASLRGAPLVAVHTWSDVPTDTWFADSYPTAEASLNWGSIEQREHAVLAERLAGWQERYPDVAVTRVVERDRPVRYLVEHGTTAQLIVMGSRGRGGFTGMLLGSTSRALLYTAPCSLLIVRPEQRTPQ